MFESKLFNEWLEEIKNNRIKALFETKEMVKKFKEAKKEKSIYKVCGYDPFRNLENESESYRDYLKKEYKYHHVIPEMKSCCCWKTTQKIARYEEENNVIITEFINIDGIEYENYLYSTGKSYYKDKERYNGLAKYLLTKGHTLSDANLIDGRDDSWIIKRAEKEVENLRKSLIAKVSKICGEEIVEVIELCELYLKGSNGRTAKLWAISAGGYNIQCLHTRVLVKEVNA